MIYEGKYANLQAERTLFYQCRPGGPAGWPKRPTFSADPVGALPLSETKLNFFRSAATSCWKMIATQRSRSAFYWLEKWTFILQHKSKTKFRSSWSLPGERHEGQPGQQDLDNYQHLYQGLWLEQVPGCQVMEDLDQDSFKLEEKLFFFLTGAALAGCALPTQNVFLMTETTETTETTPEPPALLSVSSSFPSLLFTNSKKLFALPYRL